MGTKVTIDKCGKTALAHIASDKDHGVLLSALTVLLYRESDGWFAQGLQIDHFAAGKTESEVKENFAKSLKMTMQAHLEKYGNLKGVQKLAPQDAWKDYWELGATQNAKFSGAYLMKVEPEKALPKAESLRQSSKLFFYNVGNRGLAGAAA